MSPPATDWRTAKGTEQQVARFDSVETRGKELSIKDADHLEALLAHAQRGSVH